MTGDIISKIVFEANHIQPLYRIGGEELNKELELVEIDAQQLIRRLEQLWKIEITKPVV